MLYYATSDGAFQKNSAGIVRGPLKINKSVSRTLENASICFYGQKPHFLMNVFRKNKLIEKVKELEARMTKEKRDIRLYNFAGNPMMAKMPDGAWI